MNTLTDEELDKIEERFGEPATTAITFDECMKLLRAARRYNERKWIPVTERVPPVEGIYEITLQNLASHSVVHHDIWKQEAWCCFGCRVLAYRPLPEPWRPE